MCLLLIQINIDMVPVGGEGCRFARVSGGVVGIVATCLFFCFLWKWVVQRKQKNGSFLADAAPGRYLEPTIAVTRTETASKQHEHRDQDINAHLPTDQLNFFCVYQTVKWLDVNGCVIFWVIFSLIFSCGIRIFAQYTKVIMGP